MEGTAQSQHQSDCAYIGSTSWSGVDGASGWAQFTSDEVTDRIDYIIIPGPGLPLRPVRRWPDQYFSQYYSLVRPRPWIIERACVNIQRRLSDFASQLRPHQLKIASPTPVFTLVPLNIRFQYFAGLLQALRMC